MMSFQSKFSEIAPTQARPLKSTIFPDHPHSTMLIGGGQEPGDGPGWKSWKTKEKNKEKSKERGGRGRCKAKQREFEQIGKEGLRLSFKESTSLESHFLELDFVTGLPAQILFGPNDEGSRSGYPRCGWPAPTGRPSNSMSRQCATAPEAFPLRVGTNNLTYTYKEVPL